MFFYLPFSAKQGVSTKPWVITGTECRGSREALYTETPEGDGINSWDSTGKIKSISAMPHYENRSHEELRLEDSELQKRSSVPSQSVFQQSGCLFHPLTSPVPSSQPSFESLPGTTFGTATAALVSDSYVKPTFGSFGPFPFGGSMGGMFVGRDPRNCACGSLGKTATKYEGSRQGFSATGVIPSANDRDDVWKTQSISAMPIYEHKSHEELRSEDYGLCNTCYKECRGSREAPYSETPDGDEIYSGNSTGKIDSISAMPYDKDRSYEELRLEDSDLLKAKGSQGTILTKYQGARLGFSATVVDERKKFVGKIQSISAMPIYEDKSHEELRSEDYGLCNICYKGGQTLWGAPFSDNLNHTPATAPSKTSFTPNLNPPSLIVLKEPMVKNSCQCPNISNFHADLKMVNDAVIKSFSSKLKIENIITPSSRTSTTPTLSPSVNPPFSCSDVYRSPQSQVFTLEPATASFGPTFTSNLNPTSLIPFTEPILKNSCGCLSTTLTSSPVGTFSFTEPSVIASSFIKSTPVTSSDLWPSIANTSQPQQTAEKVGPLSTNDLNTPSQASSGLTKVTQFTSQKINGPQYTPSSNYMQSVTSGLHGISSLPVPNNLSSKRRASLLRIQHVSSSYPGIPNQKPNGRSSETKVSFFIDEEDKPGPVASLLPRENPRAWVNISSLSLRTPQDCKGDEIKDSSSSLHVIERLSEDMSALLNQHEDEVAATTERHKADVLALLPKLPDGVEYYMEPSLHELAAKEMAEAGYCRHVKDFVVGRQGHGSIKFLGETDVCHLEVESIVQFNKHQVIVYPNGRKKPLVGQQLNKAAEITLLNVKCISKKTGKKYVEGHQVKSYKEILIKTTQEHGAEFVSYDPVEGEFKFRLNSFS